MKSIVHNNPVSFLQEFVSLVQDGYCLEDDKYSVVLMPNICEATLVKQKEDFECFVEYLPNTTELFIEAYSFSELCKKIQYFVAKQWKVDYTVFNADVVGKSFVRIWREEHLAVGNYTRAELEEMEWEQIKSLGYSYGCFNRKKDVLISNILKVQKGE